MPGSPPAFETAALKRDSWCRMAPAAVLVSAAQNTSTLARLTQITSFQCHLMSTLWASCSMSVCVCALWESCCRPSRGGQAQGPAPGTPLEGSLLQGTGVSPFWQIPQWCCPQKGRSPRTAVTSAQLALQPKQALLWEGPGLQVTSLGGFCTEVPGKEMKLTNCPCFHSLRSGRWLVWMSAVKWRWCGLITPRPSSCLR